MRNIGLHLRWSKTILEAMQVAVALELPIFQCFLVSQETERHLLMPMRDQQLFCALRARHAMQELFLHASYRINLADGKQTHYLLERELAWAERLNFTHLILHPGAVPMGISREESLDGLARSLNALCARELPVAIVLENVAYGGKAFGGDVHEFALLLEKLDYPEKIGFCIDTAHAYSYGYDLATGQAIQAFLKLISATIGLERLALLHGNDTHTLCGGRIDSHALFGQGMLGEHALRSFVMHVDLGAIPLILELPVVDTEEQKRTVAMVREWHHALK